MILFAAGTLASILLAFPFRDILKSLGLIFSRPDKNHAAKAARLLALADLARTSGAFALEEALDHTPLSWREAFLRKGLTFVVEGVEARTIREIMELELASLARRHERLRKVWDFAGFIAPAWGFAGTLFELLVAVPNPADKSAAARLALTPALCATVFAHLIAAPAAVRIQLRCDTDMTGQKLILEGVLAIESHEARAVLEERLKAVLGGSGSRR
ncbi:MAG: MotA/TolQ/ExbB proton channel family protein [Clostridiales bacterium]|nr:MotA/TolQ/ExbB proton channel family protein [Clostridiales bacterium]